MYLEYLTYNYNIMNQHLNDTSNTVIFRNHYITRVYNEAQIYDFIKNMNIYIYIHKKYLNIRKTFCQCRLILCYIIYCMNCSIT